MYKKNRTFQQHIYRLHGPRSLCTLRSLCFWFAFLPGNVRCVTGCRVLDRECIYTYIKKKEEGKKVILPWCCSPLPCEFILPPEINEKGGGPARRLYIPLVIDRLKCYKKKRLPLEWQKNKVEVCTSYLAL